MLKDYNYFLTIISKIPVNFLKYGSDEIIYFCLFILATFILKAVVLFFYNFLNLRF
jgi:hypothetical protein